MKMYNGLTGIVLKYNILSMVYSFETTTSFCFFNVNGFFSDGVTFILINNEMVIYGIADFYIRLAI